MSAKNRIKKIVARLAVLILAAGGLALAAGMMVSNNPAARAGNSILAAQASPAVRPPFTAGENEQGLAGSGRAIFPAPGQPERADGHVSMLAQASWLLAFRYFLLVVAAIILINLGIFVYTKVSERKSSGPGSQ